METTNTRFDVRTEADRRSRAEDTLWQALGLLWRRKWFIVIMTGIVAVASVVISLLLTPWYQATAKVVLPESGSGGAFSAFFGDIGAAASSILGIGGGDYVRYMSILDSREPYMALIDEFDLETVYETTESENSRYDAFLLAKENVSFGIDMEYEYLYLSVLDPDPQRAAEMTNYLVGVLNAINARMASEMSRNTRIFVERRYQAAEDSMTAALAAMQAFQEQHGIIELQTQTEAFLNMIGTSRAEMIQSELAYETARRQFGDDNPQTRELRSLVEAAQGKVREFESGQESLMPVAFDSLPAVAREYAELTQDLIIQKTILEFARPILEQSIFEEQRETPAVQVLEPAIAPIEKAKPQRTFIVIGATISALLLSVVFVLVLAWWNRNYRYFVDRLNTEATRKGA